MSEEVIRAPLGIHPYTKGIFFVHSLAIASTFFRLGYRAKRRQLQWDDFWALVALIGDFIIALVFLLICVYDMSQSSLTFRSFIDWSTFFFNPTVIWATRLSIAVTVVRILPPGGTVKITKASCWVFVAFWLTVMIQKIFLCGTPVPPIPNCKSQATPILGMVVNTLASVWLVVWPAYILLRMRSSLLKFSLIKLPATHHRLLLACFSTSILLMGVNISHAVYLFNNDKFRLAITGHLEVALSLFLCNLLVLVTYLYRLFCDPLGSGYATSQSRTPVQSSHITSRHKGSRVDGLSNAFSRNREPAQIYTSTQIFTLTEYPTSTPSGDSKQELDDDSHSISDKKKDELISSDSRV